MTEANRADRSASAVHRLPGWNASTHATSRAGAQEARIPWSVPDLGAEEREALLEVFDSGWLAMGPKTRQLEEAIQNYTGAKHAVAVNNGTSALIAALLASGVGAGDEVLVSTYTFVATVNSIFAVGARPVFLDCDLRTLNTTVPLVEAVHREHPKAKALLFVDIAGVSADLDALREYASAHHLALIEDAAEAFGTEYKGTKIGSRPHLATFSFHMAKQVSSVEGGAVVCGDAETAERLRVLRAHGEGKRKYTYVGFGLNLRPTDLLSAIALVQLRKAERFIRHRAELAQRYRESLRDSLEFQEVPSYCTRPTNMLIASLAKDEAQRDRLEAHLDRRGIDTRRTFPPVHQMKCLPGGPSSVSLPNAELAYRRVLSLPMGNALQLSDVEQVIDAIKSFPLPP